MIQGCQGSERGNACNKCRGEAIIAFEYDPETIHSHWIVLIFSDNLMMESDHLGKVTKAFVTY